jgi:hypothetical protein
LFQVYDLGSIEEMSTDMKIEGGYQEAEDDDMRMVLNKHKHGMNFPCPEIDCVLTFSSRDEMNIHLLLGKHGSAESIVVDVKVEDKVRRSWIKGLSGKVEARKTGSKTVI